MTIQEALTAARFVVDATGARTEVLISVAAWRELLTRWQEMAEQIEDTEDAEIVAAWWRDRDRAGEDTIPLEQLEAELIADGLLPG
jgi:hypothetical protein